MVELQALGPLEIRDADGPLVSVLAQPKRAALVAFLALARPRRPHRRDELLALFWPESDDAHARNALSQALSFLRRELPDRVLVTRGSDDVGVDRARVNCDVIEFEDAVNGDRWEQALMLYRGDLMAGLHIADASGFERWLEAERNRLRELASGAAWSLAEQHLEAGEPVEAERTAQRALALSPTDESPVRRFVEALARAGDRAAALAFYEKFRELLAEELDVEPAPETAAVAAAVRRGDVTAQVRAGGLTRGRFAGAGPPAEPGTHAGSLPDSGSPGDAGAGPSRRARGGRRWPAAAGLAAVALLAVAGIRQAVEQGRPPTLIGAGLAARYDRVVVADLASPFDPGIGRLAAEWLRTELDQSDIIRPVDPAEIGAALRRMERDPSLPLDAETAREIAVRDDYPLVVTGEMEDVGETCILTVRLESPEGVVLGRFRAAAVMGDNLVDELDRIGGEIRERIGESRASIRRSPPLEQVTTSSLEALRLYSDGVRLRDFEGRSRDAVPLFERAIELDPTFASAHRKLGVTLNNLGLGREREREREQARAAAYENRNRLTEFERLLVEKARLFEEALGDPTADECRLYVPGYDLYAAYHRRHPEDARAWHNYAWHLERVGRADSAASWYRRFIATGQAPRMSYGNLFLILADRGDRAGAREALEALRRRFGETAGYLRWQAGLALADRDYARADSLYGAMAVRFGGDPEVSAALGWLHALRGRVRQAEQAYSTAILRFDQDGYPVRAATHGTTLALVRLVAWADTAAAVAAADQVAGRYSSALAAPNRVELGTLFAMAGRPERAESARDTLIALRHGGWVRVRAWLGAAIAAARGEPDRSLALLADGRLACVPVAGYGFRRWPAILAGRAHEATGDLRRAIRAYERYPGASGTGLVSDPLDAAFLFDTLERLARLHDELGHGAEAAGYYARAADLWADADPELQPRVRALRDRAAALAGEG